MTGNRMELGVKNDDRVEPTKMLGLRIPERDHQALKVLAAKQGISMTEAVQEAIRDYLHKNR